MESVSGFLGAIAEASEQTGCLGEINGANVKSGTPVSVGARGGWWPNRGGLQVNIPTGEGPDRSFSWPPDSTADANHTSSAFQNHRQSPFAHNKTRPSACIPNRDGDSVRASMSILQRCVAEYVTFPPLWSPWLLIRQPAPAETARRLSRFASSDLYPSMC